MSSADPPVLDAALAGIGRRLLSLIYESLILAAVLLAITLPASLYTSGWEHNSARIALRAWLLIACGAFYVWQWTGPGQTLPMKTWRLKLVGRDGSPVSVQRALVRYIAAVAGTAALGLGFAWALVDRDRQFLHDRLAGTRLMMISGKN